METFLKVSFNENYASTKLVPFDKSGPHWLIVVRSTFYKRKNSFSEICKRFLIRHYFTKLLVSLVLRYAKI